MKQGRTIAEIGQELVRQRKSRKDFIADTRKLSFQMNGAKPVLYVEEKSGRKPYVMSELAQQQLASRLQIPYKYYQKMQESYPALLEENVNGWFSRTPEKRMVRTLDGQVRAFLSDRYRRLDHLELCEAVLPVIYEMENAEITSCEITEEHLYLKVINHSIQSEIRTGDVVQAGFVISNSEVGLGSLRVEPLVYRLVCQNGLIAKDYSRKKYHVGKQISGEGESYELYSDETLRQDDKAFFMKVQDTVRAAADEAKFSLVVGKMKQAMDIPLRNIPADEVKSLADRFLLNEAERQEILCEIFRSGDRSRYGLLNAVTAASKSAESYERATYLERVGGEVLSALPEKSESGIHLVKPSTEPHRELHRSLNPVSPGEISGESGGEPLLASTLDVHRKPTLEPPRLLPFRAAQ